MSRQANSSASLNDRPPRRGLLLALVVAAAIAAAAPSLRGQFVGGDDLRLLLDHPLVSQPGLASAGKLLVSAHHDLYQPLPMLVYMTEYWAYGHQALGYHIDRLILHAINALLVWLLVWTLSRRMGLSTATGVAFAVHPLAVEAFAYVGKLTIPLSTTFVLLAMITWLRWRDGCGVRWLIASLLGVIAALLCKPIVTLPLALWLLDLHRGWRSSFRWAAAWLPVAALAIAAAALNLRLTARAGLTAQAAEQLSGPSIARVVEVHQWALRKYVWPSGLSPWYPPRPHVSWLDPEVISGLTALFALLLLAALAYRSAPTASVGLGLYVLLLLPYQSSVIARNVSAADRFMYLPILGLHLAVAASGWQLLQQAARSLPRAQQELAGKLVIVVAAAAAIVWTGLGWRTTGYYRNGVTRARRATQLYPTHPHALRALARVLAPNSEALGELVEWDVWLAHEDRLDAAVVLWEQAVQTAPQDPHVRGWYALALACFGEHAGARAQADQTLAASPQSLPARLAVMLTDLSARDDAAVESTLEQLAAGLWADPVDRAALARATLAVGRMDWTQPDQPILYWTVGRLFLLQGRPTEADRALQSLVVRFPDSPWAQRANELIGHNP
ncbi:MAG TPA: hypothetical protein VMZ31_02850 [Phycisphaerae bacterium]|nr:hypothetical protein [Phycisphaerae bacterium]